MRRPPTITITFGTCGRSVIRGPPACFRWYFAADLKPSCRGLAWRAARVNEGGNRATLLISWRKLCSEDQSGSARHQLPASIAPHSAVFLQKSHAASSSSGETVDLSRWWVKLRLARAMKARP